MLTIKRAAPEERQTLWNVFQKFLYEMTNYYDNDMDSEGNYPYPYFDRYFDEEGREALFLLNDGELAGFAMLNPYSYLGENPDHVLAEFTVFPVFRRRRLGLAAVEMIFSRYPGRWEVKYNEKNTAARALWTKAAAQYAPRAVKYGEFETVLCFETGEGEDRT